MRSKSYSVRLKLFYTIKLQHSTRGKRRKTQFGLEGDCMGLDEHLLVLDCSSLIPASTDICSDVLLTINCEKLLMSKKTGLCTSVMRCVV